MTISPSPASNRRFFVDGMEFEVRAVGQSNVGTGIIIDGKIMPCFYALPKVREAMLRAIDIIGDLPYPENAPAKEINAALALITV